MQRKQRGVRLFLFLVCVATCGRLFGGDADVVVVGGTPAGIASALAAARSGRSVTLVEYNHHVGGMMTSGLGKSDIENRAMIRGLFAEFIGNVRQHYIAHPSDIAPNARYIHAAR